MFDLVEDTTPSEKLVILALACEECFVYRDDKREDIVPAVTQAITKPTRRAQWFIRAAIMSLEEKGIVGVYCEERSRPYCVRLNTDPPPAALARLELLQQEARERLGFSLRPLEPLWVRMERHTPSIQRVYEDCVFALDRLCHVSVPINVMSENGSYAVCALILVKPMAILQQGAHFFAYKRGARRALYYLQLLGLLQKYPVLNSLDEELYDWFVVPGQVDYQQFVALAASDHSYETYLYDQHRREAGLEV